MSTKTIQLKRLLGQATNVDPEDMDDEQCLLFKDVRHFNGYVTKVLGESELLTGTTAIGFGYSPKQIVAYHHDDLTNDYVLLAVGIKTASSPANEFELKYWNATRTAWYDVDDASYPLIENTLPTVYHANDRNPVVRVNNTIRFLAGKASGTSRTGIWIGHIDRDFFDGLYLPTASYGAGFYAYKTDIDPPDISSSGLNLTVDFINDGAFSNDDNVNEDILTPNEAYGDLIRSDEVDVYYYKFSYVYDGNQESLLSDAFKVVYNVSNNIAGKFQFDITAANHNKRITAMKVYRSSTAQGTYYHIQTIDFTRKSENALKGTADAVSGKSYIYIPELATFDFQTGTNYKIYLMKSFIIDAGGGNWGELTVWALVHSGNTLDGTGIVLFTNQLANDLTTYWDAQWKLVNDDDANDAIEAKGEHGAFGGIGVVILGDDYDDKTLIGGIINVDMDVLGGFPITGVADGTSIMGGTTLTSHSIYWIPTRFVGDIVRMYGFETYLQYNGIFRIYQIDNVASNYGFHVFTEFIDTDTGYWDFGEDYIIEKQNKRAIGFPILKEHTDADAAYYGDKTSYPVTVHRGIYGSLNAADWAIASPQDGMYFCSISAGVVTYTFYDNGLLDGAEHPYQNAVSLQTNGKYAFVLKNRLFLGDIILDPADKAETHTDWIAYSEEDNYDVMNVSNVKILPDNRGGDITGIVSSFGALIVVKPHIYYRLNLVNPSDPDTWVPLESVTSRGNVATGGVLSVGHKFYPVSHDGIHEADLNIIAATDETPMLNARVSEPVNDVFLSYSASERAAIFAGFDPIYNEIYFSTGTGSTRYIFNTVTKQWRRSVGASLACTFYDNDQNGDLIFYNSVNDKVYKMNGSGVSAVDIKTKRFRLSFDRDEIVRYLKITYATGATSTFYAKAYVDPSFSGRSLGEVNATTGTIVTQKIPINERAKAFYVEFLEDSPSTNTFILYEIEIEVENA